MEDFIAQNKWELITFGVYVILVLLFRAYIKFVVEPKNRKK